MLTRQALGRIFRLRLLVLILVAVSTIYVFMPRAPKLPPQDLTSPEGVTPEEQIAPSSSAEQAASILDTPSHVSETVLAQPSPASDRPEFHVVVAHYEEEPYYIRTWLDDIRQIPYVQELGLHITIYTKGPSSSIESIRTATGADSVIKLPNIGREGGSYLRNILENYDDPPLFTLFTQSYLKKAQQTGSGPSAGHLMDWLQKRLREKLDKQTGFMSLDRKHDICYCGHCTDMGRDAYYPLWSQLYALITGVVCQSHQGNILSFNGHFIVSRKRILARPRRVYEYLEELVNAPEDHWIHSEPEPKWFEKEKGKSIPSDPKFGHTLERLWHTLFACDRPEEVTDCDIAGMKAEGPGGCSCKD